MAFNKTKYIDAAQKALNQGKIAQAITEYQQILRYDPKDQITLMTVGDLYVRMGETFQALEYFERLAQHFLNDGFISKAIAIYKKIAKLAPEETRPLERLAELYVQQGVLSEARPLYLHLAEIHLRANRHPQAVALLRALLEAEPENLRVHTRLADLYQTMGQPQEAVETCARAAQRLLDRGDHAEAEKFADRALRIDARHAGTLALKARALAAQGKHTPAIQLLESLPGLDPKSDAMSMLVEQHLHVGGTPRAAELARKAFEQGGTYELSYVVVEALLEAGEADRALDLLGVIRKAMLDAGDHERLSQALTATAQRLPARLEPREWLVELYGHTSDAFRLPDALAQLAEATVAAGQIEKAHQVYEQLFERNQEDEAVRQRLNELRAQLGLEPVSDMAASMGGRKVEPRPEAKPAAKSTEPPLDDETQRFVTQALTDVDLFSSYGLAQKAVDLLETVLKRVPRHAPALEKLLDLSLGAGNDRRTAELAAQLEQIYLERGDAQNAERFFELRRRYQRAAGIAPEGEAAAPESATAPAASEPALPMAAAPPAPPEAVASEPAVQAQAEPEPVEVAAVPLGEPAVHEIDLSEEWAALAKQVEAHAEPLSAAEETPEAVEARAPVESVSDGVPELQPETLSSDQLFAELASEFGMEAPVGVAEGPAASPAASPSGAAQAEAAEIAGPLGEVLAEFKAELGEMGEENEDPETHYNLGIAYREMGLLEEAIGEFQKVAQASEKGRPFRYAMQCCTLLGLSFLEQGQPEIAAVWYERALKTPGLDQESVLALRYDLGVAQQSAGDEAAALKSFSQVYAMNIDYRDVAERIAALGKRR